MHTKSQEMATASLSSFDTLLSAVQISCRTWRRRTLRLDLLSSPESLASAQEKCVYSLIIWISAHAKCAGPRLSPSLYLARPSRTSALLPTHWPAAWLRELPFPRHDDSSPPRRALAMCDPWQIPLPSAISLVRFRSLSTGGRTSE